MKFILQPWQLMLIILASWIIGMIVFELGSAKDNRGLQGLAEIQDGKLDNRLKENRQWQVQ